MHSLGTYPMTVLALGAIAFGIYLLVKGGDATIGAATWVAETAGISRLAVAATVVAFGTSAPELFTSVNAALSGYPGISLGNVIGSNVANTLLVLGAAALVMPIVISPGDVRVDVGVMLAATVVLAAGLIAGLFPRWLGILMLLGLITYVIYQYRANRLDEDDVEEAEMEFSSWGRALGTLGLGLLGLVVGSELLVQGAIAGGVSLGVPEAVIGLTVIAFGTSLPELTTCLAAARKGASDMIVGGILGSNIFNILSIVAITSIVRPLDISARFLSFDLPVVSIVTVALAVILLKWGRIGKATGGVFLALYVAFIGAQYLTNSSLPDVAIPAGIEASE